MKKDNKEVLEIKIKQRDVLRKKETMIKHLLKENMKLINVIDMEDI